MALEWVMSTDIDAFTNYPGIDQDTVAIEEIDGHIKAERRHATNSLDDARKKLGGQSQSLIR